MSQLVALKQEVIMLTQPYGLSEEKKAIAEVEIALTLNARYHANTLKALSETGNHAEIKALDSKLEEYKKQYFAARHLLSEKHPETLKKLEMYLMRQKRSFVPENNSIH